jgi:glycosyltransferase involved in cell wall biosynthesis
MDTITIAIPTYNRPDKVLAQLRALELQIKAPCRVVVIDNCSEVPVSDLFMSSSGRFSFVRNASNIGSCANVLRCIELCETKWVAILGDDDVIVTDYIDKIIAETHKWSDALWINFSTSFQRRASSLAGNGIIDLVEVLDNWANLLFISASIFDANAMRENLRFGYHYAYSLLPHVAIAVRILEVSGRRFVLSDQYLVDYGPADDGWPKVFQYNTALVLELIGDRSVRNKLRLKMNLHSFSIWRVFVLYVKLVSTSGKDEAFSFAIRYQFYSMLNGRMHLGFIGRVLEFFLIFRAFPLFISRVREYLRKRRDPIGSDLFKRL